MESCLIFDTQWASLTRTERPTSFETNVTIASIWLITLLYFIVVRRYPKGESQDNSQGKENEKLSPVPHRNVRQLMQSDCTTSANFIRDLIAKVTT